MAKIAVMGHGVVGSGVVEITLVNGEQLKKRCGETIEVKRILDLRDFPGLSYSNLFTKDFQDIVNDEEISVVCEMMGGVSPAYEFTKACLEKGKSVVTSNKELVAQKGAELLQIAKQNNVNYFFEASVGGGIPIIRPLHQCLAANKIEEITGILNGTTNFILSKMLDDNMPFEEALALAQQKGYAEKDPTADIEGDDACRKICILAALAYGNHIYPKDVHKEGISKLTLADVRYARSWDGEIKLIGRAAPVENGKVTIMVGPMLVPQDNMLSSVDGVFNAVTVKGNMVDKVTFVGRGAGKSPTASAVVADVVDAVKSHGTSISQTWIDNGESMVADYLDDVVAYYMRVKTADVSAAKAYVEQRLPEVEFLDYDGSAEDEIAFVTQPMVARESHTLEQDLEQNGIQPVSKLRILQ